MKSFIQRKPLLFLFILSVCYSSPHSIVNANENEEKKWFTPREVTENVWWISDAKNNNTYLVIGEEKALLVDTGRGAGDLRSVVESLTNLPVIVVNTHAHGDHCGGNFQWDKAYMHPADFKLWKKSITKRNLKKIAQSCREAHPELAKFFFTDYADYKKSEIIPTREGDVFDLGGRQLEVIETPGHTAGCICLLDRENKLLFAGDNNCRHIWLFRKESSSVEEYLKSLKKLMSYSDSFDMMLIGHDDPLNKDYLDEVLICCEKILKGEGEFPPYSNFGEDVRECTYKRSTVAFNINRTHYK